MKENAKTLIFFTDFYFRLVFYSFHFNNNNNLIYSILVESWYGHGHHDFIISTFSS